MQNYLSFIVLIKKYQCKRTTKSKQQRKIKTKLYDKRDDFTFPMVKFLIHQYYYCSSASVWSFHFKTHTLSGADPGFQVRGAHLKTLLKIVGIFRVKNYDFTPKNHIFSNCGGRRENVWGISCEKSRFYAKKSYFFPILGGRAPWIRPWLFYDLYTLQWFYGQNPAADVITTHLWLRCSYEIV